MAKKLRAADAAGRWLRLKVAAAILDRSVARMSQLVREYDLTTRRRGRDVEIRMDNFALCFLQELIDVETWERKKRQEAAPKKRPEEVSPLLMAAFRSLPPEDQLEIVRRSEEGSGLRKKKRKP